MKLAIFDIDGVLVRGSTERAFWWYLLRSGRQGPRQLLAGAAGFVRYLPGAGVHVGKVNKAYLSGLRYRDVQSHAEQFIEEWVDGQWFTPAVDRLAGHREQADAIVLLSGTLEPLAMALAARLRVGHVLATVPSCSDGVCTAKLPDVHPFAATKRTLGESAVRELGFDWRQVSAYGDSYHDLALLERAGEPVAVRPDKRLRAVAVARGWEILDEDPGTGVQATPGGACATADRDFTSPLRRPPTGQ